MKRVPFRGRLHCLLRLPRPACQPAGTSDLRQSTRRSNPLTKPRPTVDLGYPTDAYGRIPAFQDIEEEAEFWDTHDTTEFYGRELQPVELSVSPELRGQMTLHLDVADRAALAEQARAKSVSPATLARDWLVERLRREAEAEATSELVADAVAR